MWVCHLHAATQGSKVFCVLMLFLCSYCVWMRTTDRRLVRQFDSDLMKQLAHTIHANNTKHTKRRDTHTHEHELEWRRICMLSGLDYIWRLVYANSNRESDPNIGLMCLPGVHVAQYVSEINNGITTGVLGRQFWWGCWTREFRYYTKLMERFARRPISLVNNLWIRQIRVRRDVWVG